MASAWLFGNFDTANWNDFTGLPADYEIGTPFCALAPATLDKIRWYRGDTDPDQHPTKLRVWDVLTGSMLYEIAPPDDNGLVGYQEHTLSSPLLVDPQQQLIVSATRVTYRNEPNYAIGQIPPPDFPAALWTPLRRYIAAGMDTLPSGEDNQFATAVDAHLVTETVSNDYTVEAETDYSDAIKWEQEADRYLLDVTTIAQWDTAKVVEGVDVRRIVGGWQPLSGSYQGKRFPIDSPHAILELPGGGRMKGVLIDTSPGSAGHVQALVRVT